jgi:hypothetical protein
MRILTSLALFLGAPLLAAAERIVVLPPSAQTAIGIECPVGQVTRILFPEPLKRLKGLGSARAALGLRVERLTPTAVLAVEPLDHPAQGTIEFVGPTLQIRLDLTTVAEGRAEDLRLVPPQAAIGRDEGAPSVPPPVTTSLAVPRPSPTPPAAPSSTEARPGTASALDLAALLTAEVAPINRREGLPGQPELRLLDALKGDEWIWFRLRLKGSAAARIRRVFWEEGDISTFTQEPRDGDLRIVVQVPRPLVRRRSRISIETDTGVLYRIALRRATLPGLLGSIFH